MKVLWRSDMDQGKHDPLEITHVVTKSGSQISAALVVPMGVDLVEPLNTDETAGLLEVIEAQLAAIDELSADIKATGRSGADYETQAKEHRDLQEWADQFPDMIADLCVALGFAAHPVGSTGIPELDILVSLSR